MVSKQLGAQRLLALANALGASVDKKEYKFNLDCWVGDGSTTELNKHNCGTAGCAIGYCPVIFPDDWGYREKRSYDGGFFFETGLKVNDVVAGKVGFEAATEFFGFGDDDGYDPSDTAVFLFSPDSYDDDVDVNDVIDRIRDQAADMVS